MLWCQLILGSSDLEHHPYIPRGGFHIEEVQCFNPAMCKLHTCTHMVNRRAGRDLYAFATPTSRRTKINAQGYACQRQENIGEGGFLLVAPWYAWPGLGWPIPTLSPNLLRLSAQIRAVLLPASHLAINGDCSKHRGGVRSPRNIPYSSTQLKNKHWSPIKKDTERRIHVNTCHGSVTLSHEQLDVAEVGDGVLLYVRWQPGYEPKAKQSWAPIQMDQDLTCCNERRGSMFLSFWKHFENFFPTYTARWSLSG